MHSEPSVNDQPMAKKETTRKKLTDEEKKARQKEHAKAWYLKKKAAAGKPSAKKKKPAAKNKSAKKKQKQESGLFLYWKDKKDDMFQEVMIDDSGADVQNLFIAYPKLEEIYLMQRVKRYSRPVVVVTELM